MTQNVEQLILKNLIHNDEYSRKVLPFLNKEYFIDHVDKLLYGHVDTFINKYNNLPTKEALLIEIDNSSLRGEEFEKVVGILNHLEAEREKEESPNLTWLLETTEKFCQDKAIYNAVVDSIKILDEPENTQQDKGSIPKLLTDALSVSFDPHIGHDYLLDSDERYEFYHKVEKKIPFDLEYFNKITQGGLSSKTLNIALAGTGVGKSLFMCHFAANCISQGYNVLYITLEMAEERIAERIDANLLNIPLGDLVSLPKSLYEKKMETLKNTVKGRALLNELNLKRSFKPDIIYIDYLNICSSARIKPGQFSNSYGYIKSIAEELRGLSVELDVPILSATQTNRQGFGSSDVSLEDTSESFGLPATADFMFAIISNEALEEEGQIMIKQLKNRYSDITTYKKFLVGIDRTKMKLIDLGENSQSDLVDTGTMKVDKDDVPLFDRSTKGKMSNKKDFGEFKFE
jgi:archaellum biogenesis ATPase FlaH